jgi:hypothetical protein
MSTINLTASNPTEQRVLDYLTANASEVLAEKINAGKKSIDGALDYAKDEAKKLASGQDCVCVDDATVFGWIIHYFEEEHITEKKKASPYKLPGNVAVKPAPVLSAKEEIAALTKRLMVLKPEKKKRSKKIEPTQSMFDALFGDKK